MKTMRDHFIVKLLPLCLLALVFAACDANDSGMEEEPLVPNTEGFYVFGTNTIAPDVLDPDARMALAQLDPTQGAQVENMPGVYGKFMYIGAGGTVEFQNFEGDVSTSYGVEDGGAVVNAEELANVPLATEVIYGTLVEDGPPVQVAEEGLYYTFVNTLDNSVVLMKVEPNIIGDATEGQWEAGTAIPQLSVSADGAVFEATDVPMNGAAGYKWRFSDGWHAYASPDVVTHSFLGVESYGEAWDAGTYDVGFFTDNIPSHEDGLYTLRLAYDAETGTWTETKTKTGNLAVDYSATEMAIIGSAVPNGSFNGDGTGGYGQHAPTVDGNVYTWSWDDVELTEAQEFIFLEGATWGGLQIDYTGATNQGAAIDNGQIVDATTVGGEYHNYYVAEGGAYDVRLVIDAAAGTRTITFEPAG